MSISNLADLSMSRFRRRTKQRLYSTADLSISWPLESGRCTPNSTPQHSEHPTRPNSPAIKSSIVQQPSSPVTKPLLGQRLSSVSACSDCSEDIPTPELSRTSSRRESAASDCLDCDGDCIEATCMGAEKLPSQATLELAGEVEILDGNGNSRTFKSLYDGSDAMGEQQLVIFVRHFFCPGCQRFLQAISKAINMKTYFSLPVPTSITIIGLGDHKLIPTYRSYTGTKFPIFTDPSRKLHRLLGMTWSLSMGPQTDYWDSNALQAVGMTMKQMNGLSEEKKSNKYKGGAWWWVGGEFLIKEGKMVWCHRMRNYRDHAAVDTIKDLLGVESA